MKNLQEINKIRNLLIDAKVTSLAIDNFNLTCKLDVALNAFLNEYNKITEGVSGLDIHIATNENMSKGNCNHCEEPKNDINSSYCCVQCEDAELKNNY